MVPFCDPVGWVDAFGPVVGPILAALSVVFYPVYLLYLSYLMASALGQGIGIALAQGVLVAAIVGFAVAVLILLVVAAVGVVFLCIVTALIVAVLRILLKPTPINEPWTPRRWPGRSAQVG